MESVADGSESCVWCAEGWDPPAWLSQPSSLVAGVRAVDAPGPYVSRWLAVGAGRRNGLAVSFWVLCGFIPYLRCFFSLRLDLIRQAVGSFELCGRPVRSCVVVARCVVEVSHESPLLSRSLHVAPLEPIVVCVVPCRVASLGPIWTQALDVSVRDAKELVDEHRSCFEVDGSERGGTCVWPPRSVSALECCG